GFHRRQVHVVQVWVGVRRIETARERVRGRTGHSTQSTPRTWRVQAFRVVDDVARLRKGHVVDKVVFVERAIGVGRGETAGPVKRIDIAARVVFVPPVHAAGEAVPPERAEGRGRRIGRGRGRGVFRVLHVVDELSQGKG